MTTSRPIAVWPQSGRYESLEEAVRDGGGTVVPLDEAEALIWADASKPDELRRVLAEHRQFQWVSLPFAGIEPYLDLLDDERVWTAAKGVYADPVAEHALTLGLAGLRGLAAYARADAWSAPQGHNLLGAHVTIFGAGGITDSLIRLLDPFGCTVTVVRRRADAVEGAQKTIAMEQRLDAIASADLVVLALALTPETEGFYGQAEFAAMKSHAWLVNVARGGHVDVDALVAALPKIGGAGLDVTSPEPLPEGHPLWSAPNVFITPHIANTPEMGIPLLAARTADNVRRFSNGDALVGIVDVDSGY